MGWSLCFSGDAFSSLLFSLRDALSRGLLGIFQFLEPLRRGLLCRGLLGRAPRLELGLGALTSVFFLDA